MIGLNWAKLNCQSEPKYHETCSFYEKLGFKLLEVMPDGAIYHLFDSNPPITFYISNSNSAASNLEIELNINEKVRKLILTKGT